MQRRFPEHDQSRSVSSLWTILVLICMITDPWCPLHVINLSFLQVQLKNENSVDESQFKSSQHFLIKPNHLLDTASAEARQGNTALRRKAAAYAGYYKGRNLNLWAPGSNSFNCTRKLIWKELSSYSTMPTEDEGCILQWPAKQQPVSHRTPSRLYLSWLHVGSVHHQVSYIISA